MALKSLDQHNKEVMELHKQKTAPIPNGIACPKCGSELVDLNPTSILMTYPNQKYIKCMKCKYVGTRYHYEG